MTANAWWSAGPFFSQRMALDRVNYRLPASAAVSPPPVGSAAFFDLYYRRLFAVGSGHPGGANVGLADGSVRFLADATPVAVLQELATRASGNVLPPLD